MSLLFHHPCVSCDSAARHIITSEEYTIAYNITGDRRKALVEAIANYTGEKAIYQNAPSFAYHIGLFSVDKNGTLSGPIVHSLIRWLAYEGFTVEE